MIFLRLQGRNGEAANVPFELKAFKIRALNSEHFVTVEAESFDVSCCLA
jgi:hypothetical protein